MDPRLDAKWDGRADPRTTLPLDPWTRARQHRRREPVPLPWGLHAISTVGLIVSTIILAWYGLTPSAVICGLVSLLAIGLGVAHWLNRPIR